MFGEELWNTDDIDQIKRQDLQSFDYKESPTNMTNYLSAFFFHFIYFNFLGPFAVIFFLFTKKTRFLAYNMQILRPTLDCFLNLLPWIANAFIVFSAWMTGFKQDYYYVLTYQIVTISILKCAIIAGKYGSFSHEQIEQLYSRYITIEELNSEHMLASWADQSPQQIFKTIDNAMRKS